MTAPHWASPRRSRRAIGLAGALFVQGLAVTLLWLDHGTPRLSRADDSARLTAVRLLPPKPPRRTADEEIERRRPATPQTATRTPAPILIAAPEVTVTAEPPPTAGPAIAPVTPPPGAGRSTLNLALPPRRAASDPAQQMAEQVRNDPRSHSERRSVEWAIADAAGTLPVETSVSTSGSGSKLVRQGSKCVRVYENRVAAMNPTDDRLKGAPALVGKCFP